METAGAGFSLGNPDTKDKGGDGDGGGGAGVEAGVWNDDFERQSPTMAGSNQLCGGCQRPLVPVLQTDAESSSVSV